MKSIIYQVLPRLWGNGTFASWDDEAFAYLHTLGVNYIWFTGIPRHASGEDFVKGDPGSPYAICDWYDVNPYLAVNTKDRIREFQALVGRTHSAGFKCLVDFIPNHVACNYKGGLALYGWHDGDWTDTLKVDWSAPQTPAEMEKILRYWASMGVDGFRCDMVELVDAAALGNVISAVRKDYPDLLFVAEVYQKENYVKYLTLAGFDLLYDKSGTYDILRGILSGGRSARELTRNWQSLGEWQGRMLNFLENHDEQRLASPWFAGTPEKAWSALAFSMLYNDASFMLYAGQETGENASEGHEGRTSIFNWSKPASLAAIDNYIHTGKGLGRDRKHILSRYKDLLNLAGSPLFTSGSTWDLCYCQGPSFNPDRHFAFVRYNGTESRLILCNFSTEAASLTLSIPEELRSLSGIKTNEATLQAAPFDYASVKLK